MPALHGGHEQVGTYSTNTCCLLSLIWSYCLFLNSDGTDSSPASFSCDPVGSTYKLSSLLQNCIFLLFYSVGCSVNCLLSTILNDSLANTVTLALCARVIALEKVLA